MKHLTLYIGNKNISSWSFRAWLAMKIANIEFHEVQVPLYLNTNDYSQNMKNISPSERVPCLHHKDLMIWDTTAIIEYLYETFPNTNLYPQNSTLRSIARSCMAEMHSGFLNLRSECPMNMQHNQNKNISDDTKKELQRIYEIWSYCKQISGSNEFLLGEFSAIDCFFAPIVSRIISYSLDQGVHSNYINKVYNFSHFQNWRENALQEK